MSQKEAAKTFFQSSHFAVVGASSDPTKFGHRIFKWYTHHNLPVTPINPSSAEIQALPPYPATEIQSYATLPNLSALPNPTTTGISIITPPKVTKKVLEEAKKLGVIAVWLQPGTYNDDILEYIRDSENFKAGVGGEGGGTVGTEGWCILVDGEAAAKAAERKDIKL